MTTIPPDLYVARALMDGCKWVRAYKRWGTSGYPIREWPAGTFWIVDPGYDWGTEPAELPDVAGPFTDLASAYATAVLMGVM